MGQDLCSGFSLENAITDQFTPPHFSILHLYSAKCTWFEMKHGNGLCLWTLSKHSGIVCHMLHHAQVAHQNDFKLERIHPLCSYLIWAFTLSPLSFNRLLLIGVFFLARMVATLLEHLSCLVVWMSTRRCSVQLITCTHNTTFNTAAHGIVFPLMLLWMSNRRARVNLLKWWYVYKHYLTMADEYSQFFYPGRKSLSAISQSTAHNYATSKMEI